MNHLAQTSTSISDAFPERDVSNTPYLQVLAYPKYIQEPQRTGIMERPVGDSSNFVFHKLLDHIYELLNSLELLNDWDGDDGHAPAEQDVWNAIKFLKHIPPHGIISAGVMIIGDGDVGFDWAKSGRCLEVGFRNAKISFYGKTPDGERLKGTEDFKDGVVPVKLQSLMNANFFE